MSPHQRLGIGRDADEREIKRAYARELKRCRPDEDAQGFQALQEAYRYCLDFAAHWRLQDEEDESGEDADEAGFDVVALSEHREPHTAAEVATPPVATSEHEHDPAHPATRSAYPRARIFELAAELAANDEPRAADAGTSDAAADPAKPSATAPADAERATPPAAQPAPARAHAATVAELAAELAQHAETQHVETQPAHFDGDAFLRELLQRAHADSPHQLLRWLQDLQPLYSLDLKYALREPLAQVLAQIEPPLPLDTLRTVFAFFALDQVGAREARLLEYTHRAQARAEGALEFQRALAHHGGGRATATERMLLAELRGPVALSRRLFIAVFPGLAGRAMSLAALLLQIDRERAARHLDPGSVEFWRQATDPTRLARPRVFVALLRILLYPLPLTVVLYADGSPQLLRNLPGVWLGLAGVWLAGALIRALWLQWRLAVQRGDDAEQPLWRDAPLQLFAGAAVAVLAAAPVSTAVASLLAVAAAWMWTIARGRARVGRTLAAFAAGLALAVSVPAALDAALGLPAHEPADAWVPLFLIGAATAPVLQDLYRAVSERIGLARARADARTPWLALAAAAIAVGARVALGV